MTTRRGSTRKGADYEREVRKELEALGFNVMRSAASKGPYDLFAYRTYMAILVQTKSDGRSCRAAVTLADSLRERGDVPPDIAIMVVHPTGVRFCQHAA